MRTRRFLARRHQTEREWTGRENADCAGPSNLMLLGATDPRLAIYSYRMRGSASAYPTSAKRLPTSTVTAANMLTVSSTG
jgi:hypothetical protein